MSRRQRYLERQNILDYTIGMTKSAIPIPVLLGIIAGATTLILGGYGLYYYGGKAKEKELFQQFGGPEGFKKLVEVGQNLPNMLQQFGQLSQTINRALPWGIGGAGLGALLGYMLGPKDSKTIPAIAGGLLGGGLGFHWGSKMPATGQVGSVPGAQNNTETKKT